MLKKLTFDIGGREIELTEAEARELLAALKQLLDKPVVTLPDMPIAPNPWPTYPDPVKPFEWQPWMQPVVTTGEKFEFDNVIIRN